MMERILIPCFNPHLHAGGDSNFPQFHSPFFSKNTLFSPSYPPISPFHCPTHPPLFTFLCTFSGANRLGFLCVLQVRTKAGLKIHSRYLHAHCNSFIQPKSTTNRNTHLTKIHFQASSKSEDQRSICRDSPVDTDMLDFGLIFITQIVKPQTVRIFIYHI